MKYYNYTLKIGILNILSIILFILCFIIVVPIYGVITLTNIPLMMILSILYLMLHEVVHYIGFIINKEVNSKNIVMGAELEKGIFYCMCKQKISKKTILISIFAPLTTLGFITLIIAMIFKLDLLIFLSSNLLINPVLFSIRLLICLTEVKYPVVTIILLSLTLK